MKSFRARKIMSKVLSQAKVAGLLAELRALELDEPRPSTRELARRYELDPWVVIRLCESEGVLMDGVPVALPLDDPNADTQRIELPVAS